jgi:hypothetical protein
MTYLTPADIFVQFAIAPLVSQIVFIGGIEGSSLGVLAEVYGPAQSLQNLLGIFGSDVTPIAGPFVLPPEWLVSIATPLAEAVSAVRLVLPPPTGPLLFPAEWADPVVGSAVLTASFVPLDVSTALANAVDFPPWVGTVTKYTGLCVFVLGLMAWLSSYGYRTRVWGRRVAVSGIALTVAGFAFGTFVDLLKYVLTP